MLDFEGKRIFCVRYAKMKYIPFLKPQQDKTKCRNTWSNVIVVNLEMPLIIVFDDYEIS